MPPHVKDPLRHDQQGPPSPTIGTDYLAIKCDGVTHRPRDSNVVRPPSTDRIRRRRASTHVPSVRSTSPVHRDIDVTPREPRRGRSVSFNPILRFKPVKHINDYSDRDCCSIWLMEEELEDIFDHCVETVKMMVRGELLLEDEGYCPRGLEFKTPAGARARKESKALAMKLVLDEQDRQVRRGIYDPELIATMYRDAATDTRRVSRIMAMKDQEAARPMIQSKSSILLLRQKKGRGELKSDASTKHESSEQDFDISATSVVDEFNLSWENCLRQQRSPSKKAVPRVRF
jgi:hypothetical protein